MPDVPKLRVEPESLVKMAENRLTSMIAVVNTKSNEAGTAAAKANARLDTIDTMDLPGKVVEMSRILTSLAVKEGKATRLMNWSAMTAQQMHDALHELVHWRETIWRRYFPEDYRETMQPCWIEHGDAVQFTGALYGMWCWAHLEADASPSRQAEWFIRWRPMLQREIQDALKHCKAEQAHVASKAPERTVNLDAEQDKITQRVLAMQEREAAAAAATP
ncbi:hypothetical protein ACIRN5_23375 [Lysinibacillus fusiformis]|uniref:hypothetical protein n=1 Tax=Lysinibacillus fusiformis TaxID=28031 RepID=UPI00380CC470